MNRNYNLNEPPGREQVKVLYYTGCGLLRHCQAYKIVTHANRFEEEKAAKTAGGKKPKNRNAHQGRRIQRQKSSIYQTMWKLARKIRLPTRGAGGHYHHESAVDHPR